uniref:AAA family ATPase n=1 Tax=Streptomyces chartreusis TaxID=1969 RepID=UPI003F4978E8
MSAPVPEADEQILRRHFLAIATGAFDAPEWKSLPVSDEVDALNRWLCDPRLGERRFTHVHEDLAADPDRDQVRDVLERLPWREADAAVVFVTGHGERADGAHWIVLRHTEPGRWYRTAIRTADVVGWLKDSGIAHLLLIFDLCYAGSVNAQTALFDSDVPRNWLVLPSAAKNQPAAPGAFTTAVTAALADLASPIGERFGRHNRLLRVEHLLEAIGDKLGPGQRVLPLTGSQPYGPHACLPNPHYRPKLQVQVAPAVRDLALLQTDMDAHWAPRARGVADASDPGWLFTGRANLMRALIEAARGAPGTVMLTGAAGTGKSAVLARLVTLADAAFVAAYRDRVELVPDDLKPRVDSIDVAVLATGKTAAEIAAQIGGALGLIRPDAADPRLDRWSEAWSNWLEERSEPVTVVVDAVDEAADPSQLLHDLLARLPDGPGRQRLRLVLGVRSPGGSEGSTATEPQHPQPLADRIARRLEATRIPVDESPWYDPDDLIHYAEKILASTPHSPYAMSTTAADVARALATRAQPSYLIVRIAAASLARRHVPVAPGDPQWLNSVDEGMWGVFRADWHHVLTDPEQRTRTLHLLRAVAFARGKGLPWHHVWPTVANAIAEHTGLTYGDRDIAELLASPLGGYLTTDVADDTTVYRLFHDALRPALARQWRDLLEAGPHARPTADDDEIRAIEAGICRALLQIADHCLNAETIRPLPPYIRRHLIEHAGNGHLLNDRTIHHRLLPYLDISRLLPHLDGAHAHLTLAPVLHRLVRLWNFSRPQDNATTMQLWAAALGAASGDPIDSTWRVAWARWMPDDSHILGRHYNAHLLAGVLTPEGRPLAVTGSNYSIKVWDLTEQQTLSRDVDVPDAEMLSLTAVAMPDGQVLALFGNASGVWTLDLLNVRAEPRRLPGSSGSITSISCLALPHGGPMLALALGGDGIVRVWNVTDPNIAPYSLEASASWVQEVTGIVLPDGRALALAAGPDGLWVWDLTDLEENPWSLYTGARRVHGLSGGVLPDGRARVVAGGFERVWVWDLTGERWYPWHLREAPGDVQSAAVLVVPDQQAYALAAGESGVWVWDLGEENVLFHAQDSPAKVLAVTGLVMPDNHATVLFADEEDLLRVWDLPRAQLTRGQAADTHEQYDALVVAVRGDGSALVIASADGYVETWPLTEGPSQSRRMRVGSQWMDISEATKLPDGRTVVFARAADQSLWAWDLTDEPYPLHGASGGGDAMAGIVLDHDRTLVLVRGEFMDEVWIWDMNDTQSEPRIMDGITGDVWSIAGTALTHGGAVGLVGSSDGVWAWDLNDDAPALRRLRGPGAVRSVATLESHDGRALGLAGDEEGVWIYDLAAEQENPRLLPLQGVESVTAVRLHNGRAWIIAGSDEGRVLAWDAADGSLVASICAPGSVTSVSSAVFPDGRVALLINGTRGSACLIADAHQLPPP